jgi:hypothetical protein
MLFNIYTNDQPIIEETKHFLYADDLALAAQDTTFQIVERKLTKSLQELTNYYINNQLRPNPDTGMRHPPLKPRGKKRTKS